MLTVRKLPNRDMWRVRAVGSSDLKKDFESKVQALSFVEAKPTKADLHDWFSKNKSSDGKPGWKQAGGPHDGGHCARYKDQKGPVKCVNNSQYSSMTPGQRQKALKRKQRMDPNQGRRRGPAINVPTMAKAEKQDDACIRKVKARYHIWPSAYASGAVVQCRKKGANNWGNSKKK